MKRYYTLLILTLFLIALSGCSILTPIDSTEKNSEQVDSITEELKNTCESRIKTLDEVCFSKDISNIKTSDLKDCGALNTDRKAFIDSYCDVEIMTLFSTNTTKNDVYSEELEKRCRETKIGELSVEEYNICTELLTDE